MATKYTRKELENLAQVFVEEQKDNINKACKYWGDKNNENIIPKLTGYIDKYGSLSVSESFECVNHIRGIRNFSLNSGDAVIVAALIRENSYMISQCAFNNLKEMLKKFHNVDITKRVR